MLKKLPNMISSPDGSGILPAREDIADSGTNHPEKTQTSAPQN